MVVARLVPVSQAMHPPSRRGGGKKKRESVLGALPPSRPRHRRRPDGASCGQYIRPWEPVANCLDLEQAYQMVLDLQHRGVPVFIPKGLHLEGVFMVHYDGAWRRFMVVDGVVHCRVIRAALGTSGPGRTKCDGCGWWDDDKSMIPVMVGVSIGSMQMYRICGGCFKEGIMQSTKDQGYLVHEVA